MLRFLTITTVLLCCCCAAFSTTNPCGNDDDVTVAIKQGKIRGNWMLSNSGRCFQSYRGIPYAKPPVVHLRFKAPVEHDGWSDVLNATVDASLCIQKNAFFSQEPVVEGSEDCLFLNVYIPKVQCGQLLPVMVFIHYGGFFAGSGRSDFHGPEYFMDKDVILVTFNYRLGVLGFLSTFDDASPGNWGFKDQVAALRWVQQNIIHFGGNNKRVTIFGQSAGAGSTHHHILSPLSKGLFHAAISQSGSALAAWAKPQGEVAAGIAKSQATFVGCRNDTDSYTMVNCLRQVPAAELVDSIDKFRILRTVPLVIYGPALEIQSELNPEPFITQDPIEIIFSREFEHVPWMLGDVGSEGILSAAPYVRQSDMLEYINEHFDDIMPNSILGLYLSTNDTAFVWSEVQKFYMPANRINVSDPETITGLINVLSDRVFLYSSYQSALVHSWVGHNRIFFYHFKYRGEYTYGDLFAATDENVDYDWGVCHCDDLLYLFTAKFFPKLTASKDKAMIQKMIAFFTNFAIHGEPTPKSSLGNCAKGWDPIPNIVGKPTMENSDLHYLHISGRHDGNPIRLEMRDSFYPKRMSFWEKLPMSENIPNLH